MKISDNQTLKSLVPNLQDTHPIIIIGCGGIVKDGHLPAYQMADYQVQGLFDTDAEKSSALSSQFNIATCYKSKEDVLAHWHQNVVFDLAVPAAYILDVLEWLPENCAVLIQKPLGNNLVQAKQIVALCRKKNIRAAVNFQLRYSPNMRLVRQLIEQGAIGEIRDIEVRVTSHTPWHLWPFLYDIPRVEILYHSIHYIDVIRSFCGTPSHVQASTIGSPEINRISNVRSNIIMDYGEAIRATISTNHMHDYGSELQESYFKCEGTAGAVKAVLGVNLDYPKGKPDSLQYFSKSDPDAGWQDITIAGNWFPHAFIGSMGSLLLAEDGQTNKPATELSDALETMAVVEAAYDASQSAGVALFSKLKG